MTASRIKNPDKIYYRLKSYVDAAENYKPRRLSDVDPEKIESKTIQLAVPEFTSPMQWRYLFSAIIYSKEHGVRIVITRIRE